jgi:hypothetical protein
MFDSDIFLPCFIYPLHSAQAYFMLFVGAVYPPISNLWNQFISIIQASTAVWLRFRLPFGVIHSSSIEYLDRL